MKQYDNQHHRTIDESSDSRFSQAGRSTRSSMVSIPQPPPISAISLQAFKPNHASVSLSLYTNPPVTLHVYQWLLPTKSNYDLHYARC
ncbi:hypothetical protein L2E82_02132 [Cichorium intybus]|uniref:Uncharacterized protein n=1 Tax=Cichorium intybus TaxID=13427 RepID=A0ACB9H0G1_CICIN|nr:hypothetical protein L2E82_02132 [Cichorium intybus]